MARAKTQPPRPVLAETGGWTALTPERHAAIVEKVAQGVYPNVAARSVGINPETFRRWMSMGEDKVVTAEDGSKTVVTAPEPFRGFRVDIEKADADAEAAITVRYREVAEQAAFGNAAHMAGFMGRRWKERWDPKTQVEVSGPDGGPIPVKVGDEIDRLAGALEALARAGVVALPGDANGVPEGADPTDE